MILALAVFGALAAQRLYDQAMVVRAELQTALGEASKVKAALLSGDFEAAEAAAETLTTHTQHAFDSSRGDLWAAAEVVPFVGPNFEAVRQAATVAHGLAANAVVPLSGVRFDLFRPVDGKIDVEPIADVSTLLTQANDEVSKGLSSLGALDHAALIDEVSAGVAQLHDALVEVQPLIAPVQEIFEVLPGLLGAEGPRDYLLMFQGNSEARSLGGNAAIFTVLHAEDGALTITHEISSQDFDNAPPKPVTPLDPAAEKIFGDKIGRYTADFTMVPDFPDAVRILQAWWEREGFPSFDSVLSFDPVALSYLLKATGPVDLPTGEVITTENAPAMLLNEVYFKYTDPNVQNLFFAGAASAIFNTISAGNFDLEQFAVALERASAEGRLLYWTTDERETELISGSRLQGVMPSSNEDETVIGVFVNDNTSSKKSYYLDMGIEVCAAGERIEGSVTLHSSLTEDVASSLPRYITGSIFKVGSISTYLVIYGPVGASLDGVWIDGRPARILSTEDHLGRPAVKVEVYQQLTGTREVEFAFDADSSLEAPLDVWHTPMVRDTEVLLSRCG